MQESELTRNIRNTLSAGRIEQTFLPMCPEISLYLLNADFPQDALSAEEAQAIMSEPAYWIFCWASGQALSRWILDHPQSVRGKRILDFGTGSGVLAIAAAMAGAERVWACDIDPAARQAASANARLNGVSIEICGDWQELSEEIDMVIVADVLYDRENLPLLDQFIARAPEVLVADSRVKNFSVSPYKKIATMPSTTLPDLDEFDEFREVRIYYAEKTA
jgi:predicted nicotinamide N-methyase